MANSSEPPRSTMAEGGPEFEADLQLDSLSERYTIGALLGEGRFSQVSRGCRVEGASNAPDGEIALKVIPLATLDDDDEAVEMLEAEVAALRRAAATAKLAEVTPTLHEVLCTSSELVLVMDRVRGCELFELIDRQGALPEPTVRSLMAQLLSALAGLHALGIVHRDIKPENLMVSPRADRDSRRAESEVSADMELHLTVIDFGYAALLEAAGPGGLRGLSGSPEYAAPEVLSWLEAEGNEGAGQPYSSRCDVWSTGVTAHVLVCAELPFDVGEEEEEALGEMAFVEAARVANVRFEQDEWQGDALAAAREFVRVCMQPDPTRRPTAAEALSHRWFDGQEVTSPARPPTAASAAPAALAAPAAPAAPAPAAGAQSTAEGGANKGGGDFMQAAQNLVDIAERGLAISHENGASLNDPQRSPPMSSSPPAKPKPAPAPVPATPPDMQSLSLRPNGTGAVALARQRFESMNAGK